MQCNYGLLGGVFILGVKGIRDINKREERLGEEKMNYQGCSMKIVRYNNANDIIVEFQDKYNAKVNTQYKHFVCGKVKNPYYPSIYSVGIVGDKYQTHANNIGTKEYQLWCSILERCFSEDCKKKCPAYKNVSCCNEWLYYPNFYEWLHNQENFDKWINGDRWAIDKDILVKENKIYSPNTCCLVPQSVNQLFVRHISRRGSFPIGVSKRRNGYASESSRGYFGEYSKIDDAFKTYKRHKEDLIKQTAIDELAKGNITKQCYEAMMNYEVEITD